MPQHLHVKILDRGDPGPAFPKIKGPMVRASHDMSIALLQDGTEGGQAAVCITSALPNGGHVFLEFTQANFENLISIWRGALQKWSEAPNRN